MSRTLNGFFEGPLRLSMVNLSPGGPHAFILLDEPQEATQENLARVEAFTEKICDLYGGDPAALDAGHLLRLPYTHNTKPGHVAKHGGPVLIRPMRFDVTRRENIENIEAAIDEKPAGLYGSGEWTKPKRAARAKTGADGATVDNPFAAFARQFTSANPAAILAEVDNHNVRNPLLRAVGHLAWVGAGEDATAEYLAAWAKRLSDSRNLGWNTSGKHLEAHMAQFRSDAAKAARHGRDLAAEREKFAARWGEGQAGVDAYMNDRAAAALEEIVAAVVAGEGVESAKKAADALRELFDPKPAAKKSAAQGKREQQAVAEHQRRAERLADYSQETDAAGGGPANPPQTKYAGEVVFDPARGAWVDLLDKGRRAILRESVTFDETDPASGARAVEAAFMRARDAAPEALKDHIYEFGKSLVRIAAGRAPKNRGGHLVADVVEIERPFLIGRMGAVATFRDRKGEDTTAEEAKAARAPLDIAKPTAPPTAVADIILASRGVRAFQRISGLRTCPTIRPDGSILSEDGRDAETGLVLVSGVALPSMIAEPTREDAIAAMAELADLFFETRFERGAEDVGLAVAISGILSALGRPAVDFVPIHAASSPTPGSGKGFVHEVASLIANGAAAASMPVAPKSEETEKRLSGMLLSGRGSIVVDNANGILESDLLAQIATQATIVIRQFNTLSMIEVDNSTMVFVNGNNLRLADDLTRRALMCMIDTGEEQPERRHFQRDTLALIRANRGKYVAAALTVLRAFMLAKKRGEAQSIEPPIAGFRQWSDLVRSALIWCGYADPAASMNRVRESDPVYQGLTDILPCMYAVYGTRPQAIAGMIDDLSPAATAYDEDKQNLKAAILTNIPHTGKDLDSRKIAMHFQKIKGRIAAGLKLTMVPKSTKSNKVPNQWRVAPPDWVDVETEPAAPAQDNVVQMKSKAPRF